MRARLTGISAANRTNTSVLEARFPCERLSFQRNTLTLSHLRGCMCVCVAAPAHGTNRAQVSATVHVTVGGRPCEHAELLYVAASPQPQSGGERQDEGSTTAEGDGVLRPPTQFSNTAALVRSDTLTWAAGELGVRYILVNMDTVNEPTHEALQ